MTSDLLLLSPPSSVVPALTPFSPSSHFSRSSSINTFSATDEGDASTSSKSSSSLGLESIPSDTLLLPHQISTSKSRRNIMSTLKLARSCSRRSMNLSGILRDIANETLPHLRRSIEAAVTRALGQHDCDAIFDFYEDEDFDADGFYDEFVGEMEEVTVLDDWPNALHARTQSAQKVYHEMRQILRIVVLSQSSHASPDGIGVHVVHVTDSKEVNGGVSQIFDEVITGFWRETCDDENACTNTNKRTHGHGHGHSHVLLNLDISWLISAFFPARLMYVNRADTEEMDLKHLRDLVADHISVLHNANESSTLKTKTNHWICVDFNYMLKNRRYYEHLIHHHTKPSESEGESGSVSVSATPAPRIQIDIQQLCAVLAPFYEHISVHYALDDDDGHKNKNQKNNKNNSGGACFLFQQSLFLSDLSALPTSNGIQTVSISIDTNTNTNNNNNNNNNSAEVTKSGAGARAAVTAIKLIPGWVLCQHSPRAWIAIKFQWPSRALTQEAMAERKEYLLTQTICQLVNAQNFSILALSVVGLRNGMPNFVFLLNDIYSKYMVEHLIHHKDGDTGAFQPRSLLQPQQFGAQSLLLQSMAREKSVSRSAKDTIVDAVEMFGRQVFPKVTLPSYGFQVYGDINEFIEYTTRVQQFIAGLIAKSDARILPVQFDLVFVPKNHGVRQLSSMASSCNFESDDDDFYSDDDDDEDDDDDGAQIKTQHTLKANKGMRSKWDTTQVLFYPPVPEIFETVFDKFNVAHSASQQNSRLNRLNPMNLRQKFVYTPKAADVNCVDAHFVDTLTHMFEHTFGDADAGANKNKNKSKSDLQWGRSHQRYVVVIDQRRDTAMKHDKCYMYQLPDNLSTMRADNVTFYNCASVTAAFLLPSRHSERKFVASNPLSYLYQGAKHDTEGNTMIVSFQCLNTSNIRLQWFWNGGGLRFYPHYMFDVWPQVWNDSDSIINRFKYNQQFLEDRWTLSGKDYRFNQWYNAMTAVQA